MLASSLLRGISYNKNLTKHSIPLFSRVLSSSTAATNMSQAEATSTSTESNPKTSENKEPIRLRKKIIVFGGNGFVGQGMVKQALARGLDVISINRSGSPREFVTPRDISGTIEWVRGDIFHPEEWRDVLQEADGVISCVGAFGSNEFMEKINGDANILAIEESLKAKVPRFVYVSAVESNLPDFVLPGYFRGKRRAEAALHEKFGDNGIVLRPGFIHGTRTVPVPAVGDLHLPLWVVGKPLETIFSASPFRFVRDNVPGMQALLAQPVSVEDLAKVGVASAVGDISNRVDGIFHIEDIHTVSKQL